MSRLRACAYILSLLVLLAVGAVDAANGAPILLSDHRHIQADAVIAAAGPDGTGSDADTVAASPPSPFAPWTEVVIASASVSPDTSIATASQSSTITPTLFTGTLSAEVETTVEFGVGGGEGFSDFRVGFQLATPHRFVLTGFLEEEEVGVEFPSGIWLTFGSHAFEGPGDVSATGILSPGTYDFRASVSGLGPGRSCCADTFHRQFATFEFALTEVPEPSTLTLLTATVAGAAWCSRRKVRSGDV